MPYGLKGYKPHGVAVKRLAASQTFVLSGFPESVPSTPINYDNSHLNNDWARAIAEGGGAGVNRRLNLAFAPLGLISCPLSWEITMIRRDLQKTARELWSSYPVLTVTGPRQSGKTTLVKAEFTECEYVNLEFPDVRAEVESDARGFLSRHPAPVILDEIQNVPELVSYIQAEVDASGLNAQYVLTGSHQPALQAAVSQSLAGRTGLLELLLVGDLSIVIDDSVDSGERRPHGL